MPRSSGWVLVLGLASTNAHADFKERPFLTGELTLDVLTPGSFGAQGRTDITIADPVWITVRGRTNYLLFKELKQNDPLDMFDVIAGFDLHKYYGPGSLSFFTYAGTKLNGPQGAGEYVERNTYKGTIRVNWVLAFGMKGIELATTDPPKGDGKLHFGHSFLAGLQYHSADGAGSHRTTEVYALRDNEGKSWGGEVLWHFGLGRAVGGMDLGFVPRPDGGTLFMWALFELGISYEL